jgi:dTDP-4-dehydrorhamnose 3,5-epimerase
MVKIAIYDAREGSPTRGDVQEIFIGEDNYALVRIPPGVYNGWKCIGVKPAIIANCATEPHDPSEMSRLDPFASEIPYRWDLRHG